MVSKEIYIAGALETCSHEQLAQEAFRLAVQVERYQEIEKHLKRLLTGGAWLTCIIVGSLLLVG